MLETYAHRLLLLWGWKRRLAALVAGALSALSHGTDPCGANPFLTLPTLVLLIDGSISAGPGGLRRLRPAFATGWWFGFGYFIAGLYWIGIAFFAEGRSALLPLMPVAIVGLAGGLALFVASARRSPACSGATVRRASFALALGLGGADWLRGHVLTGFPWNPIGQAVASTISTAQAASLVGVYGLGFAGVVVFAAPVLLVDEHGSSASSRLSRP